MDNRKPKVSVILPSYNRAHLIGRSIQSVLDQTFHDFEIIVVDDGSTDNTEDVIKSYSDSRIRYIRHQENRGGSAARNTGIKAANGEYIAFQDSDDEWLTEKLKTQMEIFKTLSPEVGLIYTDMFRINSKGNQKYLHSPTVVHGNLINPRTLDYQVAGIGIQSTLVKKECFNKVGYFDEKLPRYIDFDMFIRLLQHYNFHHIKKPFVNYWAVEGISSNNKALPIARKILLKKYFDALSKNDIYLAYQYYLIGRALQSSGKFIEGMNYILKAFKTTPLAIKFPVTSIFILFYQKIYSAPSKVYRKMKNLKLNIWK